jgi:succinate-acetate transporter protein
LVYKLKAIRVSSLRSFALFPIRLNLCAFASLREIFLVFFALFVPFRLRQACGATSFAAIPDLF